MLVPIGIALVINIVLFGVVGMALHRNAVLRRSHRNTGGGSREQVHELRGLMCVFVILGLVWIFGVLINTASGTGSLVLQYLFAITATLQGVGIFFFNVYLNTNALAETSKALSSLRSRSGASSRGRSSSAHGQQKNTSQDFAQNYIPVPRSNGRTSSRHAESTKKTNSEFTSRMDDTSGPVLTYDSTDYDTSSKDAPSALWHRDFAEQNWPYWFSEFNDFNPEQPELVFYYRPSAAVSVEEDPASLVWESPRQLLEQLEQQQLGITPDM